MTRIINLIISISFLFSCDQQKISTYRAILFYDSVNKQINLTRPLIQKLIDKTTETLNVLKDYRYAVIDTTEFISYLDSARIMNKVRLSSIDKITEVDNQINYKRRLLDQQSLLRILLQEKYPACIQIFAGTGAERFERASSLMLPSLQELKKALNDVASAKIEFKNKYGFTAPSE